MMHCNSIDNLFRWIIIEAVSGTSLSHRFKGRLRNIIIRIKVMEYHWHQATFNWLKRSTRWLLANPWLNAVDLSILKVQCNIASGPLVIIESFGMKNSSKSRRKQLQRSNTVSTTWWIVFHQLRIGRITLKDFTWILYSWSHFVCFHGADCKYFNSSIIDWYL